MLGMPELSWEGKDTAVIFNFLLQLLKLAEKFKSSKMVFAWDSKKSYRKDIFPDYKANRKKSFESQDLEIGKPQFRELNRFVLPTIGFHNSFQQTGVEADDIMAKIVLDYWPLAHPQIVLVTADKDMYQMLRKGYDATGKWDRFGWVIIYNPATKKNYTGEEFQLDYGIRSLDWADIKSIAGCSGDNIPGCQGVGEKTAIKYWLKQLTKGKKFDTIEEFRRSKEFQLTKSLVTLPFYETSPVRLMPYKYNSPSWPRIRINAFENICYDYGFHSFLKKEYFLRWKALFNGEI